MDRTDRELLEIFAHALSRQARVDSKPEFRVVIEDPERGVYGVSARSFHDADRAGFSDYLTKPLLHGLTQTQADRAVGHLLKASNDSS